MMSDFQDFRRETRNKQKPGEKLSIAKIQMGVSGFQMLETWFVDYILSVEIRAIFKAVRTMFRLDFQLLTSLQKVRVMYSDMSEL